MTDRAQEKDDVAEINALFESGDAALRASDIAALSQIFADDYIQYDDAGHPHSKQEILAVLRSGRLRYPSIVSTGRIIRLFGNFAVVHGSEADRVVDSGKEFEVRYVYLDVLVKQAGLWKIVASQLSRAANVEP